MSNGQDDTARDELIKNCLDLQSPSNIQLSKSGQDLVYTTALPWMQKTGDHNVSSIWHAQSGKANSARQLTYGLYNDRIPQISPDGKTVAFVSDRFKQGESCAIYLLPLTEGGEARPITPQEHERGIEQIRWSPDGKSIAFISADEKSEELKAKDKSKDDAAVYGQNWPFNRLRVLDIETKKIETIFSLDKHISEFDWHFGSNTIAIVTQRTPEVEPYWVFERSFYTVSPTATSSPKHIADFPCEVISIAHAGDTIYFVGSASKTSPVGSYALFKIDLDKPTEFVKVAHGDKDCAGKLKMIDGDLMCSVLNGLEHELEIVGGRTAVKLANEIDDWHAAFPKDSDELIIALSKSDINSPSEVYTKTASGGALVKLSNHGHAFKTKETKSKPITCKSRDNETEIQGILFTPKDVSSDSQAKPWPTIVNIHGGPYSRSIDKHNPTYFFFAETLLQAGYAVLQINYRGSSGRGEDFAAKARGSVGKYDYQDIVSMVTHCIESGYIDKDQLMVDGWSQGGYLTHLCSVRNGMDNVGFKFKAAIAGAGVSDCDTMTFTSDVGLIQAIFAGKAAWESDKDDISNREGSPIWEFKKAAEVGAIPPMLILHGKDDLRVPIEQARAFRRGLEHYNLPFELVEYPREGHVICERKHLEDMINRVVRFVEKHLTKP